MSKSSLLDRLDTMRSPVTIAAFEFGEIPLIYVNPEFEELTGYKSQWAVGRDCRFLQGPDTSREAVKSISKAVKKFGRAESCLLNYRKDGTPFYNLLIIEPIVDESDKKYFLGCQYELRPNLQGLDHHVDHISGKIEPFVQLMSTTAEVTVEAIRSRARSVKALVRSHVSQNPIVPG